MNGGIIIHCCIVKKTCCPTYLYDNECFKKKGNFFLKKITMFYLHDSLK